MTAPVRVDARCNHWKLVDEGGLWCFFCKWRAPGAPAEPETLDDVLERLGHAGRTPRPEKKRGPKPRKGRND